MKLAWDSQKAIDRADGKYDRVRSDDLYHTAKWTRISRAWRASHPLCEECKKIGIIKAGEVTDHIIPYPVCGNFYDMTNLQTLCEDCNHDKGQRDKQVIAQWRRSHHQG